MAKANSKKGKVVRDLATERMDKALTDSIAKVEDLAKKRILQARDPFRRGLIVARDIRRLADKIEEEVFEQGYQGTEAGIVSDNGH